MLSLMGMRNELLQILWEVIVEMEQARVQCDDDQAQRLEGIAWRLVGVIEGIPGRSDCQIRKH